MLWAAAIADDTLRPRMAALDDGFRGAVTKMVERGQASDEIDTAAFAALFLGQLRGIALQHLLAPKSVDLNNTRMSLKRSLRSSLRPAPSRE